MAIATVHVSAADLELAGSYDPTGDVLYLSAPSDDKNGPAQETPEGHAVRLDADGRITHLTAINAKWLLDRDGELVATLRDGRQLRLSPLDVDQLLSRRSSGGDRLVVASRCSRTRNETHTLAVETTGVRPRRTSAADRSRRSRSPESSARRPVLGAEQGSSERAPKPDIMVPGAD
jgi:hypothetical protein